VKRNPSFEIFCGRFVSKEAFECTLEKLRKKIWGQLRQIIPVEKNDCLFLE